jgi:hypothetical protein
MWIEGCVGPWTAWAVKKWKLSTPTMKLTQISWSSLYPNHYVEWDMTVPTSWTLLILMWITLSKSSHYKAHPPSHTTHVLPNSCRDSRLLQLLSPLRSPPPPLKALLPPLATQGSSSFSHHSTLAQLLSPLKVPAPPLTTQGLSNFCNPSTLAHLLSPLKAPPTPVTTQVSSTFSNHSRLI